VLYEMLAGHPPFAGTTVQSVLARHAVDPVPSLRTVRRTVPTGVEKTIERALAKVPADRFATARDFAEALAAPDPAPEPNPELPRRALLPLSSRQRKVTLAALAVLVVAMLAVARLPRQAMPIATLDPKRVAVATFANNTGDATLATVGDMTADRLASGLNEIQLVQVVDARGMQGGVETGAQARQGSGSARMLAQGLGAGTVLWGSYYRRGDSLEFEAQLTDTRSGQIIAPIQSAAGPAAEPSTAIELFRQHAMAALAWHFDPRVGDLENSSRPSSYAAYREFIAGREFLDGSEVTCRFAECGFDHWRRAYALDSTFTLPLIEIARQGDNFGGCELTDSIAEALRLRHDRLPALDRARLDAAVAGCHGHRGTQLKAARMAVEAAPRSAGDALYLNGWLARTGSFREAVAVYQRFDPAKAGNGLVMPYHLLGEHDKELAAADAAHQADPGILWFMVCQARADVGLGRLPQMERVLVAMLSFPTNRWGATQAFVFNQVARDLDAHGYSAEARELYERTLAWYRSRPQEEQNQMEYDYAVVLYGAGHWAEARAVVQHLIATGGASDDGDLDIWHRGAQSYLGGIAAHLRDQREMDRVDRWLAGRKGPYLTGVPTFDRARMAAISGDRERAITLIRLAMDQGYPLFLGDLGLHNDPDFKNLWGYPPFEELRRPKESSEGL
jgi:TolB-like protein